MRKRHKDRARGRKEKHKGAELEGKGAISKGEKPERGKIESDDLFLSFFPLCTLFLSLSRSWKATSTEYECGELGGGDKDYLQERATGEKVKEWHSEKRSLSFHLKQAIAQRRALSLCLSRFYTHAPTHDTYLLLCHLSPLASRSSSIFLSPIVYIPRGSKSFPLCATIKRPSRVAS